MPMRGWSSQNYAITALTADPGVYFRVTGGTRTTRKISEERRMRGASLWFSSALLLAIPASGNATTPGSDPVSNVAPGDRGALAVVLR